MTCPDCERYKESAKNWRHKAYELSGHPLPWERGDTWVGLTDEDIWELAQKTPDFAETVAAVEVKLKEKNNG